MGFEYKKISGIQQKTLSQQQVLCNVSAIKEMEENSDLLTDILNELKNKDDLSDKDKTLHITRTFGSYSVVQKMEFPDLRSDLLSLYALLSCQAAVYTSLATVAVNNQSGTSDYTLSQAVSDLSSALSYGNQLSSLVFKDLLGMTTTADLTNALYNNATSLFSSMVNIYNTFDDLGSSLANFQATGNLFSDIKGGLGALDSTLGQVESILESLDSMIDSLDNMIDIAENLWDSLSEFSMDNLLSLIPTDIIDSIMNLDIVQDICTLPQRLINQVASIIVAIGSIQLPQNLKGCILLVSQIRGIIKMVQGAVDMVQQVAESIKAIASAISSGNYLQALAMIAKSSGGCKIRPKVPPLKVEYPYNQAYTSGNKKIRVNINETPDSGQAKIDIGGSYCCMDENGDTYASAKRDVQFIGQRDVELKSKEKLKLYSDDEIDIEAKTIKITGKDNVMISGTSVMIAGDTGIHLMGPTCNSIGWLQNTKAAGVTGSDNAIAPANFGSTAAATITSPIAITITAPAVNIGPGALFNISTTSVTVECGAWVHTVGFTQVNGLVNFL